MSYGKMLVIAYILGSIFLTVFVARTFYPLYKGLFNKKVAFIRACMVGVFWIVTPIWMLEYEMLRAEKIENNRRLR